MLLTITTTHRPATDLGFLLHKHPDKMQRFDLTVGEALVYYPEASEDRCTAALQLNVDPVGLVRAFRGAGKPRALEHYINDRPYAATSFLSVALNKVYRSAVAGRCKARETLVEMPIPVEAELAAVLGHEAVHAAARHTAKQQTRAMLMQVGVMGTAIAASDSDYGRLIAGGLRQRGLIWLRRLHSSPA